jgi:hypothetical protein
LQIGIALQSARDAPAETSIYDGASAAATKMPFDDARLPPVGRVLLRFPMSEKELLPDSSRPSPLNLPDDRDSGIPNHQAFSQDADSIHAPDSSQATLDLTKSRDVPLSFISRAMLDGGIALDQLGGSSNTLKSPPTRHIPPSRDSQPIKDAFQFIQIHDASGKADSAAGSHLRSHLMRQYHENRRQRGKTVLRGLRPSRKKGCPHVELFLKPSPPHQPFVANSFLERPTSSSQIASIAQLTYPLPQTMEISSLLSDNLPGSTSSFHETHGVEVDLIPTSQVICAQCGKLMLRYSTKDGSTSLRSSLEPSSRLLTSNSHDPFHSLPVSVDHNMHIMVQHCKNL